MILSQLTRYLKDHQQATLQDLAYRFDASPDAIRGMLSILEHKGRVRRIQGPGGCVPGCSHCDPAAIETYAWVDTDHPL